MDTITHTLFGATLYGATNKEHMTKEMKRSVLFASLVGSQIPDIDVISRFWDSEGMYQMWHRGITHSLFLVPLWALLLTGLCYLFWKVKDRRVFYISLLAVFTHITIDLFNAWGTGYLEPFSSVRLSFGTIPIIDFVFWAIMVGGFITNRIRKQPSYKVYKVVWVLIILHVFIQSVQGYLIYHSTEQEYEQQALAAQFIPWHFTVIGKDGGHVDISHATVWTEPELKVELISHENANLELLFEKNPKAKTLYEWSPFVVVVESEERLGVYDPRFYRDGQSFLFEYIEKNQAP